MGLWPDKLAGPEGPLPTEGFPHLYGFPMYKMTRFHLRLRLLLILIPLQVYVMSVKKQSQN